MTQDVIIKTEKVGKKFCRSLKRSIRYCARDVVRDLVSMPHCSDELRRDEFWALHDVSFEVKRGECLGLIGQNGAGKSTLLKLLTGVTLPDQGTILLRGRVGAVLELGAGFHPLLTGRENIHLSGAILGLCKEEVDRKFDEIVDFASLGEFIDTPVKHYSSGMYVRLAFAVTAHAEPDVLLMDEALAVGDALFQAKCFAKLREFKARGTTILLVTHSLDLVASHCNRALLLDKGKLIDDHAPKEVIDRYNRLIVGHGRESERMREVATRDLPQSSMSGVMEWAGLFELNPNEDRYGTKKAEILEAGIFNLNHEPLQVLERNQEYLIKVKMRHNESMPAPIIAYTIKDPKGLVLCGTNTWFQKIQIGPMAKDSVILVVFRQTVRLNRGEYFLCLGCGTWENGDYIIYDRRFDYLAFAVVENEPRVGLFDPESVVDWSKLY